MIESTNSSHEQFIRYSDDGYIRLTFAKFCTLQFPKRHIIQDEDLIQELHDQNVLASAAGYCDWLDDSTPVQVCVGWAWFLTTLDEPPNLADGGISSNVMLVCSDGYDLGSEKTEELLTTWLSAKFWRIELHAEYQGPDETSQPSIH